jgi:hypothetical protein
MEFDLQESPDLEYSIMNYMTWDVKRDLGEQILFPEGFTLYKVWQY